MIGAMLDPETSMQKMGEMLTESARYNKMIMQTVETGEHTKEEEEYRLGLCVPMSFQVSSAISKEPSIDRLKIIDYFSKKYPNTFADQDGKLKNIEFKLEFNCDTNQD